MNTDLKPPPEGDTGHEVTVRDLNHVTLGLIWVKTGLRQDSLPRGSPPQSSE